MHFRFYGGIHPPASKTLTQDRPIKKNFVPARVTLPLSQHVGSPAEPVVKVGDMVAVGQLIAKETGLISSPVHASISGKVTKISYSVTPTQARALSVTVESDGGDQDFKPKPPADAAALSRDELIDIIKNAGIVGLGGAAFPTYVKLSPPKTKPIDTVILNGAECEPYLTADHRLMLERPKDILKGLEIISKILGAKNVYAAIEDNKLSAIYAVEKAMAGAKAAGPKPVLVTLPSRYPQGAEKQIIKAVTDRVVPAGGLPMDVGCVVQNAGTAVAIYEAVYFGKPLIDRVITLTGSCLKESVNISVRLGTSLRDLLDAIGGFKSQPRKVIFGGPMMGLAQYTLDVPVVKGVSGVLFLSPDEVKESKETVCIRCGRCLDACPIKLAPTTLMYRVKTEDFGQAKDLGIANCYECGSCAYACPAKIPLLDYMKFGKSKIINV